MDSCEVVEIKFIYEFTSNSPKLFGEILASFSESHYRCQDKKQLVSKLDRLALDFRELSNICATLVEKASSDWCENCILLCENVGESAESQLREQMVLASGQFSDAFGTMKKVSHKLMTQLDNSGLVDSYDEEEKQAESAVGESKKQRDQISQRRNLGTRNSHNEQPFLKRIFGWPQDDQPNKVAQEQKQKQEMESAEEKCETAKNTLSDVSDQKQKALHLVKRTKELMECLEEASQDLSQYFSKEANFYKRSFTKAIAKKKAAQVQQLKDLFDGYYRRMLLVTSNHNFVPCSNLPHSDFGTVELFGMRFSFQ